MRVSPKVTFWIFKNRYFYNAQTSETYVCSYRRYLHWIYIIVLQTGKKSLRYKSNKNQKRYICYNMFYISSNFKKIKIRIFDDIHTMDFDFYLNCIVNISSCNCITICKNQNILRKLLCKTSFSIIFIEAI